MKRWLKEPLLHFLLAGGALFLVFEMRSGPSVSDNTIEVTPGKVQQLAAIFEKTWQRPPRNEEMQGLIRNYVREEVVYREGVAMGLEQDDTIVRRRIRQKFEFLVDDIAGLGEVPDHMLQVYLETHPSKFRTPEYYSFRQVFLDPENHGTNLATSAQKLMTQLAGPDVDTSGLGDRTLLPHVYEEMDTQQVTRVLGREFAEALVALEPNQWVGPVSSTYGAHLVHIDRKDEARVPTLEEIRPIVLREWQHENLSRTREAYFNTLEEKYTVVLPE